MEGPPNFEEKVFFADIASVLVIAVGALSILAVWVVNSVGVADRPRAAKTVHIFTPPPQRQPKPLARPLAQLPSVPFQDPRATAKFMAEYLNDGAAFDDVEYGVATPFEITLHGNLHGSRFDLRLYKTGRQTVLLKNCMMGSCYSDWAGALWDHQPAQGSARSLLHQRLRAGILRLG